jgi:hypothetical protein
MINIDHFKFRINSFSYVIYNIAYIKYPLHNF